MRTVYALLVGINDYPERPLRGCVHDVEAARAWLLRQSGFRADVRVLTDAQATRAAVLAGIETHLGRGGPGDTALLWFSGHGASADTGEDDPREATGRHQALVCHDSLAQDGQPLLADADLGGLLDGIAGRGAHTAAVLDCCFSGGATRDGGAAATGGSGPAGGDDPGARGVAWRSWWHTPGTRVGGRPGPAPREHVLLAASRLDERAHEGPLDGRHHGLFSHALLGALDQAGSAATYRELHALADARVRRLRPGQHPTLVGPGDQRFLLGGGAPGAPFLLRHAAGGWEVDCGAAHGLRAAGAEFTLLPAGDPPGHRAPARVVTVREVLPEVSRVAPAGWRPTEADRAAVHPVTPSALAFPPAAVTVRGPDPAVRLVAEAVGASPLLALGPPHGPVPAAGTSPYGPGADAGTPLRVAADGGLARVLGGDAGYPLPPLPLRTAADAAGVADCLAHLARWHRLRDLANPDPTLSSLVRVTVETIDPALGEAAYTATGEVRCAYAPDGTPPRVRVRIHNGSDRTLWCVLLDLTDSYASSPALYPGDFVGPGRTALALRGEPVWLYLPEGRPAVPGASVRDWLKLIVAENELNTEPFRLPAWSPASPGAGARGGVGGAVLRLAAVGAGPAGSRDAGGEPGPGRWGTVTVAVRTAVP
ncbi:caspase family protein [Streptomyces sp. B1866]|uniref:caspase family protein n=1 Tax=Streptomyces sp. B1866 TaxID=3075431 RepID=UPI002892123C|nr:caspase family protein [Streptomyces sp. B1866]MDT3396581.1 caspase family protein [Streptomyces sp. B1866]